MRMVVRCLSLGMDQAQLKDHSLCVVHYCRIPEKHFADEEMEVERMSKSAKGHTVGRLDIIQVQSQATWHPLLQPT